MKTSLYVLLAGLMVAMAPSCGAMDQPTYDLDTLIHWSTDIAIATLANDSSSPSEEPTEAIVIKPLFVKPLFGSWAPSRLLHAGDKLPGLSYYVGFFYPPLSTGEKVILFLDHRPRQASTGTPSSETTPYAILRGGFFLVDKNQHVHRYFQENNSGPYVYETREKSTGLPTLDSVEQEIIKHLNYNPQSVYAYAWTNKKPNFDDVPELLSQLHWSALATAWMNAVQRGPNHVIYRTNQFAGGIIGKLVALNDRPLLLKAFGIYQPADPENPIISYFEGDSSTGKNNHQDNIAYLCSVLSSKNEAMPNRISAAKILFELDNVERRRADPKAESTTAISREIHTETKKIFVDGAEDTRLRIVCLGGLYLKMPDDVKAAVEVYSSTTSLDLKFSIEQGFLEKDESAYEALHSPCGPVSSLVSIHPENDFRWLPNAGIISFWVKYKEERDFYDESFKDACGPNAPKPKEYFILTNRRTKCSSQFERQWSCNSECYGENYLDLAEKTDLPPGDYELAYQFSRRGKVVSTGYPLEFTVVHSEEGNFIKVSNPE